MVVSERNRWRQENMFSVGEREREGSETEMEKIDWMKRRSENGITEGKKGGITVKTRGKERFP